MEVDKIIAEIDAQIARLTQARALLAGSSSVAAVAAPKARRGRPKGSKNATTVAAAKPAAKKTAKRELSPEGRKAIADAMKKRWAERRKALGK